jgi:hypothetical protein
MPSVSRRQQRYLFATKGSDWTHKHGFDKLDTSARKHPSKHRKKYGLKNASPLAIALMRHGRLK